MFLPLMADSTYLSRLMVLVFNFSIFLLTEIELIIVENKKTMEDEQTDGENAARNAL